MDLIATKDTGWQCTRLNAVATFQEISEDGGEVNKRLQRRVHCVFERFRDLAYIDPIISLDVDSELPGQSLDYLAGGGKTTPIALPDFKTTTGASVNWLCTAESIVPNPEKTDFWRHSQTWEFFTPWEDYTTQDLA